MPTIELPDLVYDELLELSDMTGESPVTLLAWLISRELNYPGGNGGAFQNGTQEDERAARTAPTLLEAVERITSPSPAIPLIVGSDEDFAAPPAEDALNWDFIHALVPDDPLVQLANATGEAHRNVLVEVYSVLSEADWGGRLAERLFYRHLNLLGLAVPAPPPPEKTD